MTQTTDVAAREAIIRLAEHAQGKVLLSPLGFDNIYWTLRPQPSQPPTPEGEKHTRAKQPSAFPIERRKYIVLRVSRKRGVVMAPSEPHIHDDADNAYVEAIRLGHTERARFAVFECTAVVDENTGKIPPDSPPAKAEKVHVMGTGTFADSLAQPQQADEGKVIPWPEDLTTLVGKRITTRLDLAAGGGNPTTVVVRRVNESIKHVPSLEVDMGGGALRDMRPDMRDLLSIQEPTPPPAKVTGEPTTFSTYDALQALYDDMADYIRVNNLGDVHHNRSMSMARAALRHGDDFRIKALTTTIETLTKDVAAYKADCDDLRTANARMAQERDEANQRHDRVCHELAELRNRIEALNSPAGGGM